MTHRPRLRRSAAAIAVVLVLAPAPSAALAPVVAMMVKQMVQQSVTSMVKDTLLGSLRGMGCKGIALSNAITALDVRGGGRAALAGGLQGMTGMGVPGMPGVAVPGMPAGMVVQGGMPNVGAVAGGPPGAAGPLGDEAMRKMQSQMQGQMQGMPMPTLDPSQMAMLAQAQAMLSQPPASPAETLATIDEMAAIGLLPKPMQSELKDCMTLLPQAAPALGMAMGMLKPMLPQIRQAREQLHALSPDEQDEVAATMAAELQSVSAEDRKLMLENLDGGFFPPRVAEGVKAKLAR